MDLRVIKTKKNIEETFLKLLNKKSFGEITVQTILEEALINRSTFYHYYEDKYALAKLLVDEAREEFIAIINDRFEKEGDLTTLICDIYHKLYDKREKTQSLWKIQTESIHLYEDMLQHLKQCFMKHYTVIEKDDMALDYLSNVYATVILTTIGWTFINGGFDRIEGTLSVMIPALKEGVDRL